MHLIISMGGRENIIACFYDCDQTLIPEYMQEGMFRHLSVDPKEFWADNNRLKEKALKEGVDINRETSYMTNLLIYIKTGRLPALSNADLQEYGRKFIKPYPGLPEFFLMTKKAVEEDYGKHGLQLEHYIISTGLRKMIQGSCLNAPGALEQIFASEFLEHEGVISWPVQNVGFIEKTRYLYEANKGTNIDPSIDVNKRMPPEKRRIPFENMIYVGDGFTDVPCMSMITKLGGQSIAIYDLQKARGKQEATELLRDRRVYRIAEADYRKGGEASDAIEESINKVARRIIKNRKRRTLLFYIIKDSASYETHRPRRRSKIVQR